mgnify:CR=1 FL=1
MNTTVQSLLAIKDFLEQDLNKDKEIPFYTIFLYGVARKSYYFLYSMQKLADDYLNGDAIIDLSRSMLENLIVTTFVEAFGSESKAERFFRFSRVEAWNNLKYIETTSTLIAKDKKELREKEFLLVKDDFMRPSPKEVTEKQVKKILDEIKKLGIDISNETRIKVIDIMTENRSGEKEMNRSWIGASLEQMMEEIDKKHIFPGTLKKQFDMVYTTGNRKNHLSPIDIETYLGTLKRREFHQKENVKIGLFIGAYSHLMLVKELMKVIGSEKLEALNLLERTFLDEEEKESHS